MIRLFTKIASSTRYLLVLSWKNLARHTKRTVITASAIAFGLGLFIFIDSMLAGAEYDSDRNLIWYETSSLRLYTDAKAAEWKKLNLHNLIDNPDNLVNALEANGIKATKRTAFIGNLIFAGLPWPEDGDVPGRLVAVDPTTDSRVFPLQGAIDTGTWLTPGSNGIVLGSWLAEDIGAKVGYPITVRCLTRDGAHQTLDLEVVGTINTGNPVINRTAILVDQSYINEHLLLRGAAGQIDMSFPINSKSADNIAQVEKDLGASTLQGYSFVTWEELGADYLALAAAKQGGSKIILFLVIIIALVGITNTMLMAMYERRRELGMMRAMGMKSWEIVVSFLTEAGGIGVIGGAIGMAMGAVLTWYIVNIGIDFGFITRDMDIGYRISSVFRGVWQPMTFVWAFVASIIMSMVVSLIPTRQALKMKVTDCLRSDT